LAAGDTLSKLNDEGNTNEEDSLTGTLTAYSFASEKMIEFKTYNRNALKSNTTYPGPAIIYEPTATTYIDSDFTCLIIAGGCLKLSQGDQ
jgi:N-methylhydantoinase A